MIYVLKGIISYILKFFYYKLYIKNNNYKNKNDLNIYYIFILFKSYI